MVVFLNKTVKKDFLNSIYFHFLNTIYLINFRTINKYKTKCLDYFQILLITKLDKQYKSFRLFL